MSKKHMVSIDDFLKEEGIFEEAQAQAVKGRCVAARRGHEERKSPRTSCNAPEDESHQVDRIWIRKRHYARQPATGGAMVAAASQSS